MSGGVNERTQYARVERARGVYKPGVCARVSCGRRWRGWEKGTDGWFGGLIGFRSPSARRAPRSITCITETRPWLSLSFSCPAELPTLRHSDHAGLHNEQPDTHGELGAGRGSERTGPTRHRAWICHTGPHADCNASHCPSLPAKCQAIPGRRVPHAHRTRSIRRPASSRGRLSCTLGCYESHRTYVPDTRR